MANHTAVLTALADPTRRAIFERLAHSPSPVGELARDLPVSRPAVSQHLKVLKSAGLVTDHPAGTRRIYSIDPARAGSRCAMPSAPGGAWPASPKPPPSADPTGPWPVQASR